MSKKIGQVGLAYLIRRDNRLNRRRGILSLNNPTKVSAFVEKTLEKKSGIIKLKSQFFFTRAITYSCFLLIPVWIPRLIEVGTPFKTLILLLYSLFMAGQWFLLGKEIDYRLKIYFRVNSSVDRLLYRLLLGMMTMLLYFNLLSFLPPALLRHCFWGTWIILGLFYSWPTRGKIVEETFSKQIGEFRFLDPFEKTLLALILFFFAISIPSFPYFEGISTLQLFFDPSEHINSLFWNFLSIHFFPFMKYADLSRMAITLFFYFIGLSFYLLSLYGLLRFFVSRRPALLGVFSVISSWALFKTIDAHQGTTISSSFSVLLVWGFLWAIKSATYRAGLLFGLLGFWITIVDRYYVFALPLQLFLIHFFFLPEKTGWYKRQFLKYCSLGLLLSLVLFFSDWTPLEWSQEFSLAGFLEELLWMIEKKALFSLSIMGAIFFVLNYFSPKLFFLRQWNIDHKRMDEFFAALFVLAVLAWLRPNGVLNDLSIMWPLGFLCVIPLEWIFQIIGRLRSQRNMIYLVYILISLLDSHVEGRVKHLLEIFHD